MRSEVYKPVFFDIILNLLTNNHPHYHLTEWWAEKYYGKGNINCGNNSIHGFNSENTFYLSTKEKGRAPLGIKDIYRRNFKAYLRQLSSEIPEHFTLYQDCQNTLNSMKVICYQLAVNCKCRLTIYNVIGNEVFTFLDHKQDAGTYQIEFESDAFPDGIYFYRLETDYFTETKIMILKKKNGKREF